MLQITLALPQRFWKVRGGCFPYRIPFSGSTVSPRLAFFLEAALEVPCPFCSTQCGVVWFALGSAPSYERPRLAALEECGPLPLYLLFCHQASWIHPFQSVCGWGSDSTLPSTHAGPTITLVSEPSVGRKKKSSQYRTKPREINQRGHFLSLSTTFYSHFLRLKEAQAFVLTRFSPII